MFSAVVPPTRTSASVPPNAARDEVGRAGRGPRRRRWSPAGSPRSGTVERRPRCRSRDLRDRPGAEARVVAPSCVAQSRGAAARPGSVASPATTTSAGSASRRGKSRSSARKPGLDVERRAAAHARRADVAGRGPGGEREQDERRQREAEAPAGAGRGGRRAPEAALRVGSRPSAAPKNGSRSALTRSPSSPSSAGSSVSAATIGDDPDDDRAGGQAAQDRVGDEQHAEHRDDEGAAAEQDGPARGAPVARDRVAAARGRRARSSRNRETTNRRSRSRARGPSR